MIATTIILLLWILLLGSAAVCDARSYRIPNLIPAGLILLFLISRVLWGFSADNLSNLYHFLIALAIGMGLFRLGWFGGGDAKFYAAIALWFELNGAVGLLFLTGLAGLVVAIGYLLTRRMGKYRHDREARKNRRVPYGVAIAIGAIAAADLYGWDRLFPQASMLFSLQL